MKKTLVVGGAGALGSEIVRQLLDRGIEVVVAGRRAAADARVRRSWTTDATQAEWGHLYAAIERETGSPVDSVVFVAGKAAFGKTALLSAEGARSLFELNFWACTGAARAAAEHWAGAARSGAFLAVLSIAARRAVPFEAYYSASKAAAARFLECLDLEYRGRGLRFLAAFPGALDTPFRKQAEWLGIEPTFAEGGADVRGTARAILAILDGRRRARVIGWRERSIALADRVAPGLYDRVVLRRRVARMLK